MGLPLGTCLPAAWPSCSRAPGACRRFRGSMPLLSSLAPRPCRGSRWSLRASPRRRSRDGCAVPTARCQAAPSATFGLRAASASPWASDSAPLGGSWPMGTTSGASRAERLVSPAASRSCACWRRHRPRGCMRLWVAFAGACLARSTLRAGLVPRYSPDLSLGSAPSSRHGASRTSSRLPALRTSWRCLALTLRCSPRSLRLPSSPLASRAGRGPWRALASVPRSWRCAGHLRRRCGPGSCSRRRARRVSWAEGAMLPRGLPWQASQCVSQIRIVPVTLGFSSRFSRWRPSCSSRAGSRPQRRTCWEATGPHGAHACLGCCAVPYQSSVGTSARRSAPRSCARPRRFRWSLLRLGG